MHICKADGLERAGIRRTCRNCKAAYMREYRREGRYATRENARNKKTSKSQMRRAISVVYVQVRAGRMSPAKEYQCLDCGAQAQMWDHRDYNTPLLVDPVCGSCNKKRGPGKNR